MPLALLSFLLKFGSFLKPPTLWWVLGGVIAASALGYGVWSWHTMDALRQQSIQAALKAQNAQLEADNKALRDNEVQMQGKIDQLGNQIVILQGKFAEDVQQRQKDIGSMTGPTPTPSAPATPAQVSDLQNRANIGMNGLFDNLEAASGTQAAH